MSDLTAATNETPDAFRHNGNGSSHLRSYLHGGGPCLNPAQGCEPVWFTTEPPAARLAAPRDQTEALNPANPDDLELARLRGFEQAVVICRERHGDQTEDGLAERIAEHVYLTLMQETRDHWTEWQYVAPEVKAGYLADAAALLADQSDTTASEEDQR